MNNSFEVKYVWYINGHCNLVQCGNYLHSKCIGVIVNNAFEVKYVWYINGHCNLVQWYLMVDDCRDTQSFWACILLMFARKWSPQETDKAIGGSRTCVALF